MSESTTEPRIADRFGLLESGEELASPANLSRILGCSNNELRKLLQGPLRSVRRARRAPDHALYSAADARTVFEPRRLEVEARRHRASEVEASTAWQPLWLKEARIAVDASRNAELAKCPQVSRRGNAKLSTPATSPEPSGDVGQRSSPSPLFAPRVSHPRSHHHDAPPEREAMTAIGH